MRTFFSTACLSNKRLPALIAVGLITSCAVLQAQTFETVLNTNLFQPVGITVSPLNHYIISDSANHRIVEFNADTRAFSVLAGLEKGPFEPGAVDGQKEDARFRNPQGLAASTTRVFVADTGNNLIREITYDGLVRTIAGDVDLAHEADEIGSTPQNAGFVDGPALDAKFKSPSGLSYDGGNNLYIADSGNKAIRLLDLASKTVSTVVKSGLHTPSAVTVGPNGVLFIADTGTHSIKRWRPGSTTAELIAGANSVIDRGFRNSSVATNALFSAPIGLLYRESSDELVVVDSGNAVLRVIKNVSSASPKVETFSGTEAAGFQSPLSIARDFFGVILVTDSTRNSLTSIVTVRLPRIERPQVGWIKIVFDPDTGAPIAVLVPVTDAEFDNDIRIAISGDARAQHYIETLSLDTSLDPRTPPLPSTNSPTAANFVSPQSPPPNPLPESILRANKVLKIKAFSAPKDDERIGSQVTEAILIFRVATPVLDATTSPGSLVFKDNTTFSKIFYNLYNLAPGEEDSYDNRPIFGPLGSGESIPLVVTTNRLVVRAWATRDGYVQSEVARAEFSPESYTPNRISLGFQDGEASSRFIGAAGQRFYAPVTLSLLPGAQAYGMQFNLHIIPDGSSLFSDNDLKDSASFVSRFLTPSDPVFTFLKSRLSSRTTVSLGEWRGVGPVPALLQASVLEDLNRVIEGPWIWSANIFPVSSLRRASLINLVTSNPTAANVSGAELVRLNRMLLEDSLPAYLWSNQESLAPGSNFYMGFQSAFVERGTLSNRTILPQTFAFYLTNITTNVFTNVSGAVITNSDGSPFTYTLTNVTGHFTNLVSVNPVENLLAVGWVERFSKTNLYNTFLQNLWSYSQAHDTVFESAQGKAVPGAFSFLIPPAARDRDKYAVEVGRPSATGDGVSSDIFVQAPNRNNPESMVKAVRMLTISNPRYIVGDVAPFKWFNAGDFGDTNILNNDMTQLQQSIVYQANYPPEDSDFFDAMDTCCITTEGGDLSRTNFLNGSDLQINKIGYGDGFLELNDLFVAFRRALDPTLIWYERYWSNGVRHATIISNVFRGDTTPLRRQSTRISSFASTAVSSSSEPASFTLGADGVTGKPGTAVAIPVRARVTGAYPVKALMFNVTIERAQGEALPTSNLRFYPVDALGQPTVSFANDPGRYAAAWLDTDTPGFTGEQMIGQLLFTVPQDATPASLFLVKFSRVSASPNGLALLPARTANGYIAMSDRPAATWTDSIPDSWRTKYFGSADSPQSAPELDADGDGFSNLAEYKLGTDPLNASDNLKIRVVVGADRKKKLRFRTIENHTYQVEASESLQPGGWVSVYSNVMGDGTDLELPADGASAHLYYRVRLQE